MKPAISIEKLSKEYHIGVRPEGGYRTLRESLQEAVLAPWRRQRGKPIWRPQNSHWALRDVSLDIHPGEVVGLIGGNGAGKSTLLKILSRITEPTHGRATLRGRVGSLLEVGTGFHPELTGRENIYLNSSILGMSRGEIDRKFDEIVAFAEIDRFLDTPVKRYSSGMYVRLAFAVAAHLDLEIMLVDEVLAVGDLEFQKKCLQKMGAIAQGGRTVIFVSHNLGIIHRLCHRAILLRHGQVAAVGPAAEVIQRYFFESREHHGCWERPPSMPPRDEVSICRVQVLDKDGRSSGIVNCEDPFGVVVEYEVAHARPSFEVGLYLRNSQGVMVLTTFDSDSYDWPGGTRPSGKYRSSCRFPAHLLAPGTYSLSFGAAVMNQQTFELHHNALAFEVAETGCIRFKRNDRREGAIVPVLPWTIAPNDLTTLCVPSRRPVP